MKVGVKIRPIRLSDAVVLREWFSVLIAENRGRLVENHVPSLSEEREYLRGCLMEIHRKQLTSMVAYQNGRLVAKADIRRLPRAVETHAGEVMFGALRSQERTAQTLLQHVIQYAPRKGYSLLIYYIPSNNIYFQNLFRSVGFKKLGVLPGYYQLPGARKQIPRSIWHRQV